MIDIKLIREKPELIKDNIKKKFQEHKIKLVDEILDSDKRVRQLKGEVDSLRHKRNTLSESINNLKKEGKDIKPVLEEVKSIPSKIKELESEMSEIEEKFKINLMQIPNIIHESVPIGKDASENVESERYGHYRVHDFEVLSHVELAEELGLSDIKIIQTEANAGDFKIDIYEILISL